MSTSRPPEGTAPLRVLVVEDEALLAMQIEQLLLDAGLEPVGFAMEAGEAFEIAREARPDLALVDLHLRDGLTGPGVMRVLTGELGTAGLFVTANRRLVPDDFAGAIGVVAKPFSEGGFAQALGFVARRVRRGVGGACRGREEAPAGLELAPAPARARPSRPS